MIHEARQFSDRQIFNKWIIAPKNVMIENFFKRLELDHSPFNGVLCFAYVDHDAGNSLKLHTFCQIETGNDPRISLLLSDINYNLILRGWSLDQLSPLSDDQVKGLSLPVKPDWLEIYEPDTLGRIRNRVDIDQFRAPGFFDDLQVALFSNNQECRPEVVWVRFEEMSEDGKSFTGKLLNEPDADFGVHIDDIIPVFYVRNDDACLLVSGNGVT